MSDSVSRPGKSPHAFMREALGVQARLRAQRFAFVVAARAAEAEALASSTGYAAADVESYFAALAGQYPAPPPPLSPWRK